MVLPNPSQHFKEYKVVIAYDFGTTYSGATYAFTHTTPTEVFDIHNWPHKGGNFYPKVPTLSMYPRRNQQQQIRSPRPSVLSGWGHGAKKAMFNPSTSKQNILLSNFKLHLDESLLCPPLENGISPIQAVADYLTVLHEHAMQELSRSFAQNYPPDTFRYCLTVPAMWSDKAKQLMRQAAIRSGLISASDPSERLILISEPEAAAIYCEESMANQVQLKDNDRIMICDAGGGTVDLIVYQVNFMEDPNEVEGKRRKRQLKEVTKGIGESCGSVFLDNRFLELLKRKLGAHVMNKISPREKYGVMEYFNDTVKPEFNGKGDFYMELPRSLNVDELPANLRYLDSEGGLDEGMLKLTGQELKDQVFDPVVNKVISLIKRQYQQIPDGRLDFLFLVGGFGSSKYLNQRVNNAFQDSQFNHIVCSAERAALAVVRGAAYYGVNPQLVVSRVSRRTYGVDTQMTYDDNIDPPSSRVVMPDGVAKCNTRFSPFVEKNEELPVDHCIQKEFFIYYGSDKSVTINLYATENDTIPRYYNQTGVHRVAKISITIPKIPNMRRNQPLHYDIRMYFGKTEIRMETDFRTGRKYNVNCDFDVAFKYSS